MHDRLPRWHRRHSQKIRFWISSHPLSSLSIVSSVLLLVGYSCLVYVPDLKCRWCNEFDVQMSLNVDQIAFKVDKGTDLGLLDGLEFQSVKATNIKSVRLGAAKILQMDCQLQKQAARKPAAGSSPTALYFSSPHDDAQIALQPTTQGRSGEVLSSLGPIQLEDGTKLILQGFSPGDKAIRLSFRAKGESLSGEKPPITVAYPANTVLGLSVLNACLQHEQTSNSCQPEVQAPKRCEVHALLGDNTVEMVPAKRQFSMVLGLPSANNGKTSDVVLTHKPAAASEFSFARLDSDENPVTTIRGGTIRTTDFGSKEYSLYASDLLQVPRESRLLIRDLRVRADGSIDAVIEGKVSGLSIGSRIDDDRGGVAKIVARPIVITYGNWLASTEWAKAILLGLLGAILPPLCGWIWGNVKNH